MEFRNIQSFNEFLNEAATTKWYDLVFNSHKNHNPNCDILEGHLDRNSLITYVIYVNGPEKGKEFMEYYSGPNYKPEAVGTSRSTSRMYTPDKIPAKYLNMWQELREIYENEYEGGKSTNESYTGLVNEKSNFFEEADIKNEAINLVRELQRPGKSNSGQIVGAKLTSNPGEIQIQKEFGSVIVKIVKVIK